MIDPRVSEKIDKNMVPLKIIWGAMLCSLAIYLFIGVYITGKIRMGIDPKTLDIVRAVLYAVALFDLLLAKILRNRALAKAAGDARPGEGEGGGAVNITPLMGSYATAMIISLALSESVAIFGLALSILGAGTTDLFVLTGVAAAAMVYYRPRKDEVLELAEGRRPGGNVYRTAQRD